MSETQNLDKKTQDTKKLFKRIYLQLTIGCSRPNCRNIHCASNPEFSRFSQETAVRETLSIIRHSKPFHFCSPFVDITPKNLQKIFSNTLKLDDQETLLEALSDRTVFECSFLKQITPESLAIDFESLFKSYELLVTKISNDSLSQSLNKASRSLYSKEVTADAPLPLKDLALFLVLILNPLFLNPEYQTTLFPLLKWFQQILKINPQIGNLLVNWLSFAKEKVIIRIIELAQQYITIEMVNAKRVYNSTIALSILLLDLAYKANLKEEKVDYKRFNNDAINNQLMNKRELRLQIKTSSGFISLEHHCYLLDAAVKAKIIRYDYEVQMHTESRNALIQSFFGGNLTPYLPLRIRRDSIVRDAMTQLPNIRQRDLKKPLRVFFEGELGIDEGGVQKEFFQLAVRQLFDPEYGMFVYNEESRKYWFNKDTVEFHSEYSLVGMIVGLAIYNGIILDLHFPNVVYAKLLNIKVGSLEDLKTVDEELAEGFRKLLDFKGDVEGTFMRTFSIEYNVFGTTKIVELKKGGKEIILTEENREEYVNLYCDYVINKSIEKQFEQFHKGFHKVCDNPRFSWFNDEELEMLICGSKKLDFKAFEKACLYKDGYTEKSPAVQMFWEVVHELSEEEKKKFLSFTTGSDRVPIRGLGDLVLSISRNGDDQQRLPSSHTCYNHLLLPDYRKKEVLKERLLVAINNAEGFGLL